MSSLLYISFVLLHPSVDISMTESNLCCWNRTQGGTDQNYLPGWSYQTSRIFTYPSMAQCTVLFQNLTSPSLLCSGSWDSSNDIIHFQYQRIQVQIQSLSVIFTINCKGTTNREKKKSAAKGHFKKFLFNSLSLAKSFSFKPFFGRNIRRALLTRGLTQSPFRPPLQMGVRHLVQRRHEM